MTGKHARMRFAVAILMVAGLYFGTDGSSLGGRFVVKASAIYGNCSEECGPSVSCEQGCYAQAPELPSFPTTCGEYAGGGPEGQCLGECGDLYCNEYNEEDPDTCYTDCGECGDDECNGPENLSWCPQDCHECNDGYCTGPYENCWTCGADCNPDMDECGPGDDPGSDEGCDEGEVQNGQGYCCEPELLYEGFESCLTCGANEQCFFILWGPGAWGCVGKGSSCGQ